MTALCVGRDPEMWDTGNDGCRLALAICAVCPSRRGTECLAGEQDRRPAGVIRAGVAYNERGRVCPICDRCGYPIDDVDRGVGRPAGCRHCRLPTVRSWARTFMSRRAYNAAGYRRRQAAAASTRQPATKTKETRTA